MVLNRIEAARAEKGISREELAKAVEKSPLTIWRYETGKSQVTDAMLHKIARVLHVRVADLIVEEAPTAS